MLGFNRIPLTPLQTAECEKMAVQYLRRLRRLRTRLVVLRIPVTHPMWVVIAGAWDAATRRLVPRLPGLDRNTEFHEGGWDHPLPRPHTARRDAAPRPHPKNCARATNLRVGQVA